MEKVSLKQTVGIIYIPCKKRFNVFLHTVSKINKRKIMIAMNQVEGEQLRMEIQHIFNSGANEIRIFEMIKSFYKNESNI